MLKLGDAGAAVRKLQRAILRWNPSALPTFGADGDYGDETKKAVEAYQRASEIPRVTYGVADATTVAYLLDVNE